MENNYRKLKPGVLKQNVTEKERQLNRRQAQRMTKSRMIKQLKKINEKLCTLQLEPVDALFIIHEKRRNKYKYFGSGEIVTKFEKGEVLMTCKTQRSKVRQVIDKTAVEELTPGKYNFPFTSGAGETIAKKQQEELSSVRIDVDRSVLAKRMKFAQSKKSLFEKTGSGKGAGNKNRKSKARTSEKKMKPSRTGKQTHTEKTGTTSTATVSEAELETATVLEAEEETATMSEAELETTTVSEAELDHITLPHLTKDPLLVNSQRLDASTGKQTHSENTGTTSTSTELHPAAETVTVSEAELETATVPEAEVDTATVSEAELETATESEAKLDHIPPPHSTKDPLPVTEPVDCERLDANNLTWEIGDHIKCCFQNKRSIEYYAAQVEAVVDGEPFVSFFVNTKVENEKLKKDIKETALLRTDEVVKKLKMPKIEKRKRKMIYIFEEY
ncbi:uncharacterized protein LOC128554894 [Mercenaria mercenaria]|uniref:uncharacterized protein LOC128554894 n=1 Tax=Mercenaria mercenaria TaxID=6596 RepID=UPI00234F8BFD|nr:uncharacterized protein LOC128554894 [Mercenaria mercenaria]